MKKITLIGFVFIISCTMKMPDHVKAESAVRLFLDSTYKPNTAQIMRFYGFIKMRNYINQQKQDIYKSNSAYQKMSEGDKRSFRTKVGKTLSSGGMASLKGSKINCIYKINNITYNTVFFIDTTFNVYSTIEGKINSN